MPGERKDRNAGMIRDSLAEVGALFDNRAAEWGVPALADLNLDEVLDGTWSEEELGMLLSPPDVGFPGGFVYFLRAENGLVKIGKARNLTRRILSLETICPVPITFICAFESDDHSALERSAHIEFAKERIRGEWFELSEEQIDGIKTMEGAILTLLCAESRSERLA